MLWIREFKCWSRLGEMMHSNSAKAQCPHVRAAVRVLEGKNHQDDVRRSAWRVARQEGRSDWTVRSCWDQCTEETVFTW
ncbi:hypothetical protein TNCV_3039121 [Trichonephila clavipes]|nr:hypothetical protein TNCV_3039121 [Trichonephila clavipes]